MTATPVESKCPLTRSMTDMPDQPPCAMTPRMLSRVVQIIRGDLVDKGTVFLSHRPGPLGSQLDANRYGKLVV